MGDQGHRELRRIFDLAMEAPADQRDAILTRECKGDSALRKRLDAMIAAAEDEQFLGAPTAEILSPAPGDDETLDASPHRAPAPFAEIREGPGSQIGPYKLLQLIGEGGFGSVFMAEQEKPVARKVALKIIKLGMDTGQIVARFEQERQALAIMDHPNIAKVFDAGATETGRPYFVMELCTGVPISEYCDRNNLSIDDRLNLFAQVCQAVQHAHTKGIIHRDIKPSNVLVSTHDGKPHAKVIDFGIAKATASKLTEKTLFTEHRQLVGTPEYMSPEQAEGTLDIDTRTDVYSLGVLLYELLTGSTPFTSRELRSGAFAELQRIIREVDPPRPSTRLSLSSDTLASVAAHRRTEPRRLGTIVRGELDWIVMKALEKDRSRRYETANGLAADIQRYLGGEAVVAAPPSAAYRLKKLVRRNKGLFSAAAAVALALLIGVIAFAWQAQVARNQRDRAVAAEAETKQRAEELQKVAEFQSRMLSQIDPAQAGAELMADIRTRFDAALAKSETPDTERIERTEAFWNELSRVNATDTAQQLIDKTILKPAVAAIDTEFKDQPLIDAGLRSTLAELDQSLGMPADALALQEQALAIRRRELGNDNPYTLQAITNMGAILEALGRMRECEAYYLEAYEGTKRVLGAEDPETLKATTNLGNYLRAMDRYDEAEPLLRGAAEASRRVLGSEHRDTLKSLNSYGYLLIMQGKLAEAEPLWREAYETGRRVFKESDPDVFVWINNYAGLIQALGRAKEAEPLFRESLERHLRVRGENHPATILAYATLAGNLFRQGRLAESEQLYREAIEKGRKALGPEHMQTLSDISGLSSVLLRQGKLAEAETLLRETYAIQQRSLGVEHSETTNTLSQLASLYSRQGKIPEAEAAFKTLLEIYSQNLGADHPDTLVILNNYGGMLLSEGRLEEAEPLVRRALDGRRRVSGDDHPETLVAMSTLAVLLERREKYDEAGALYRQAMEKFREVLGDEHPNTLVAIANFANLLRELKQTEEAEKLFREAAEGSTRVLGKDHMRTAGARAGLGQTLSDLGRYAEGEVELLEGVRAYEAAAGSKSSRYKNSVQALVELYEAWNTAEPDKGYDAKASEWKSKIGELEAPAPATP